MQVVLKQVVGAAAAGLTLGFAALAALRLAGYNINFTVQRIA